VSEQLRAIDAELDAADNEVELPVVNVGAFDHPIVVRELDPEFERLLREEEEIERNVIRPAEYATDISSYEERRAFIAEGVFVPLSRRNITFRNVKRTGDTRGPLGGISQRVQGEMRWSPTDAWRPFVINIYCDDVIARQGNYGRF
jgi:hypothetical protein